MAAMAQSPPLVIRQTATAASNDSELLFRFRESIMSGRALASSSIMPILADQDEALLLQVEVDFPEPRTIAQIAEQHRRFIAAPSKHNYEVELLDDPA